MTTQEYFNRLNKKLTESLLQEIVLKQEEYIKASYASSYDKGTNKEGQALKGYWSSKSKTYPVKGGRYTHLNITGGFRKNIKLVKVGNGIIVTDTATYNGIQYGLKVIENLANNNIRVFAWQSELTHKIYFTKQLKSSL